MPKKTQREETRDEIKSFLMKEAMIDSLMEQIFKVLDMDKQGFFTRDDLLMYLGFFQDECGLNKISEQNLDQILQKKVGVKDMFKINYKQLDQTMRLILDE